MSDTSSTCLEQVKDRGARRQPLLQVTGLTKSISGARRAVQRAQDGARGGRRPFSWLKGETVGLSASPAAAKVHNGAAC